MQSIRIKLMLTFLAVIAGISVIFSVFGAQFVAGRIVAEAQEKVRTDLNSAREIYLNKQSKVFDTVRFTAESYFIRDALLSGNIKRMTEKLISVKTHEALDILAITDRSGIVIVRATAPANVGDDVSQYDLVREALHGRAPVAATAIMTAEQLDKESLALSERARFRFVPTPMARPRTETEETSGMVLKAAAPIFDYQNNVIGVVYGGLLLNRNRELVDKVKQTVFQEMKYKGKDIGTATIFQDDLRIATNVTNEDGTRAVGTRVAQDVYNQVVREGKPWIGRAFVVNNWYITAYEPIRDIRGSIIGILYVGILEDKYEDLQRRSIFLFLGITLLSAAAAMALAYFIAQRISVPIQRLVTASKEVAHGNLETRVEVNSNDELRVLADSFNRMSSALQERDRQLKEFTTRKIMESERLAIIGQLAANVAHELNNPLQGIVSYSHLLLERIPGENPNRGLLQKIVTQAGRCTDIIRGLLDFARPRKPQKRMANVNKVLEDCLALVDGQALFHNIKVVREMNGKVPLTAMDPSGIQQVIMNLLINAAEAMNHEGRLTVSSRYDSDDQMVEVKVTDTGHGIKGEDLERIFDPFFTTKEMVHGTGLGLAISYGIIKEHSGTISVESQEDKGTTFTVRLPVSVEERA